MKNKKIYTYLGASVVTFALAAIGVIYSPDWIIISSLAVIISLLLSVFTNLFWTPRPFRILKNKIGIAVKQSEMHPVLKKFYHDAIDRIDHDLDQVIKGKFKFKITEVPEMSIFAMKLVDKECILTFPVDRSEKLLTPEYGTANEYYIEMKKASMKMKDNNQGGVVRIFILNKHEDISPNLLRFIQKNNIDNINVRIIFENDLPLLPIDIEGLDFGYYETNDGHKWVMILRSLGSGNSLLTDYIVETDSNIVSSYQEYSYAVLAKSHSNEEFMRMIMTPMNGELWPTYFAERGFEMIPPHGLSDEDADYIVESIFDCVDSNQGLSVLVLGFTPKLIRRLLDNGAEKIVSIDQFASKPTEFKDKVEYRTGNWLDIKFDEKYDAIVFDESINNLTRIQLNIFFQSIKRNLKPGGHFVGRVMGRFDDEITQKYYRKTSWDAVEMLRRINGYTHEDVSPLIICLLHSNEIAYSNSSNLVDCKKWNNVIYDLYSQNRITRNEYEKWKLQFNFKLLSPNLELLLKTSKNLGFNPFEIKQIRGSYATKHDDTRDFYRIINMEYVLADHIDL